MWQKFFNQLFLRTTITVAFLVLVILFYNHPKMHFILTEETLYTSQMEAKHDHSQGYNSTCSHAADKRGYQQKIIAFSLYGNFSRTDVSDKYLKPLKDTINLIAMIYPGWIVRIYHNLSRDDSGSEAWSILKKNIPLQNNVDLCNVTEIVKRYNFGNIFAMTWRWLPLLDEMVHTLMSRDTDSRIIPREEEAVRAWLASDRIFHIMRDHPAHCLFGYIMGCCWGVKINQDRSRITKAATMMFLTSHLHEYDYDQVLLDEFIWPLAKQNMMAHDSYCCEVFQFSQPFPMHRKDRFFVGSRILMGDGKNETEELSDLDLCPQFCLPPTARFLPEWKFC